MKVINLLGGPGCGKSTLAAGLFYDMKQDDYNVELVTECAKDYVYAENNDAINDQIYVFANQFHKLNILRDKVDYVITDSPLLLSLVYGHEGSLNFRNLILEKFYSFDNVNFFVNRQFPYDCNGRLQSEQEATKIDGMILEILHRYHIKYHDTYQTDLIPFIEYTTMSNNI